MAHAQTNHQTEQDWPGFWKGKTPCWVVLDCSVYLRQSCAAYLRPETPCWDHPATQCDKVLGVDADCQQCRVFELCGTRADDPRVIKRNAL